MHGDAAAVTVLLQVNSIESNTSRGHWTLRALKVQRGVEDMLGKQQHNTFMESYIFNQPHTVFKVIL